MDVSVELTLLPLNNDFETPIKEFIKSLRNSSFTVLENPLSTQIYGDYDSLMPFLNEKIRQAFAQQEHIVVNLKVVKNDRSAYEPSF